MFWIGFILGMVVFAILAFAGFEMCMVLAGVSWKDFNNLVDANKEALLNRDSRIAVYDEDTNEIVFEAGFKYPWSDEEDDE